MELPITPQMILTFAGAAVFCGVLTQWLKVYIKDSRLNNLLCLALGEAVVILAQCVASAWRPTDEQIFSAVLIAFMGASIATFGYETITNLAGVMGFGKRAPG